MIRRPVRAALFASLFAAACGGTAPPAGQSVDVQTAPADADVVPGGTLQFSAQVSGTLETSVTWEVEEAGGGTIDATGLYTAPAVEGTFHVRASSVVASVPKGRSVVRVKRRTPEPVVGVEVTPGAVNVPVGGSATFAAAVTGAANLAVTWSVQEGSACGSVSSAGVYSAPGIASTCHVVATSAADSTKSGSATVTVTATPVVTVSVSPASPSVVAGGTVTFVAIVSGTTAGQSTAVTWSVPAGAGSIGATSGVYVAPATPGTYVVTATSAAAPARSGTATVTITPAPAPAPTISSFTATPASIASGGSSTLAWSVSGATSISIDQGVGTVTGATRSVSPSATTTYTLTARNASGSTTASATVTVTPAPAPAPTISSFTATPASIASGGSSTLAWSVSGATNVSIDQGVGTVTGTTRSVSPSATTTYTLTATNASGSSTATASVTVTGTGAIGTCNSAATQFFPPGAPWNRAIDGASLDPESGTIIGYLAANHTSSARFQITFDFNILYADASTPHRAFTRTGEFYSPDCDPAPAPVPAAGRLESESNYACAGDGDCHLTVVDYSSCRLHELWRANLVGGTSTGTFTSGCQAIWDLSSVPPATGRGDFCTSADAAGLPIVPLVFSADEVASGTIDHAIRFILPNALIRSNIYVRPGTHSTGATSGGSSAPPYATRVRLKATKDISGLSAGAQVIARALKKYGMFLADGGNITFTAATDALTTHKWSAVGVDASSLRSLSWNDFEVVDLGSRIDWGSGSCSRTPITQ